MLSRWALSSVALGVIIMLKSTSTAAAGLLATKENGNLTGGADAVLETIFGGHEARVVSIQGGEFRHALQACVAGNQRAYERMLQ